ncbi:MAG: DUF2029 domain-containing protein [Mycobacterium sp.]|nr:DUF2029 domain-containing protein [Mycobacterium sp.]
MREPDTAGRQSGDHVQSAPRQLELRWSTVTILLVAAAVSVVLLSTLPTLWMPHIGLFVGWADFFVYRDGGYHALKDLPLYATPLGGSRLLYLYAPVSTLIFMPFLWLPVDAGKPVWFSLNVVMLVATVMLCFRLLGYRITPYLAGISALLAIACAFLEPVRTTLFFGQINLLLLLLVLWDAARPEHSRLKGIGIGVAAGIKLTPAYFVLYYLLLRQWRAAGVAVVTIAATVGLGWLVLPDASWRYWRGEFLDTRWLDAFLFAAANQSIRGGIARLTAAVPPTWLWLSADACVVAISMWIAVRLYRRGEPLLAVTVAGLSATAVSPFSWSHHWVWFVPMMVYLVHRALSNTWWWVGAVALFALMGAWADTPRGAHGPRIGLYLFVPQWLGWRPLENLHLMVYAVSLIAAGFIAWRLGRTGRRLEPPGQEATDETAVPVQQTDGSAPDSLRNGANTRATIADRSRAPSA